MSILERYPILARLPEAMRSAVAAKADAGLALSAEENAALGLCPAESRVLMPVCGPVVELKTVFGGDVKALWEIMRGAA